MTNREHFSFHYNLKASYGCDLRFNSILQGDPGLKGSSGARGDPGHPGATGDPGSPGLDGADGGDVSGLCMECNSQCNGNHSNHVPDTEGRAWGYCKS